MMRSGRQAAILEIISTQEIETQEELCAALGHIRALRGAPLDQNDAF